MKSIDQGEGDHPIPKTEIIINLLPVLLHKGEAQPIKLARNGDGLRIA